MSGWISLIDGVLIGSDSTSGFIAVERHSTFVVFSSKMNDPALDFDRLDFASFCDEFFSNRKQALANITVEITSVDEFLFRVKWFKLRLGGVRGANAQGDNRVAVGLTFGSHHDVTGDLYGVEPTVEEFSFRTIEAIAHEGVGLLRDLGLSLADTDLSKALADSDFLWAHMFTSERFTNIIRIPS